MGEEFPIALAWLTIAFAIATLTAFLFWRLRHRGRWWAVSMIGFKRRRRVQPQAC